MKVGDKVRAKINHPKLPKGTIGEITHIDDFTGEFHVRFDNNLVLLYSKPSDDIEFIIMEKKVVCPVVLVPWYKACEPYIGVKLD